jgi:hypothetical protein
MLKGVYRLIFNSFLFLIQMQLDRHSYVIKFKVFLYIPIKIISAMLLARPIKSIFFFSTM